MLLRKWLAPFLTILIILQTLPSVGSGSYVTVVRAEAYAISLGPVHTDESVNATELEVDSGVIVEVNVTLHAYSYCSLYGCGDAFAEVVVEFGDFSRSVKLAALCGDDIATSRLIRFVVNETGTVRVLAYAKARAASGAVAYALAYASINVVTTYIVNVTTYPVTTSIAIDGREVYGAVRLVPGNHIVEAPEHVGNYTFLKWVWGGGVSVEDSYSPKTSIAVSGDGFLIAIYALNVCVLNITSNIPTNASVLSEVVSTPAQLRVTLPAAVSFERYVLYNNTVFRLERVVLSNGTVANNEKLYLTTCVSIEAIYKRVNATAYVYEVPKSLSIRTHYRAFEEDVFAPGEEVNVTLLVEASRVYKFVEGNETKVIYVGLNATLRLDAFGKRIVQRIAARKVSLTLKAPPEPGTYAIRASVCGFGTCISNETRILVSRVVPSVYAVSFGPSAMLHVYFTWESTKEVVKFRMFPVTVEGGRLISIEYRGSVYRLCFYVADLGKDIVLKSVSPAVKEVVVPVYRVAPMLVNGAYVLAFTNGDFVDSCMTLLADGKVFVTCRAVDLEFLKKFECVFLVPYFGARGYVLFEKYIVALRCVSTLACLSCVRNFTGTSVANLP